MINFEVFSFYIVAILIFLLKMAKIIKKIKQKPTHHENIIYIQTTEGHIIKTTDKGEGMFCAGDKIKG